VVACWVVIGADGDDGTSCRRLLRNGVRRGERWFGMRPVRRSADATERDANDVVEDALEVVEKDGVRGALEDECELHIN
jgi:hypothetical protein